MSEEQGKYSQHQARFTSTYSDDEGDGELRYSKTVIHFEGEGIVIPMSGIEAIEKDMRFKEHPKPRWQYGIVINKGLERSQRTPKVDVSVWFEKEAYRDERFDNMMEKLEGAGYNVIKV